MTNTAPPGWYPDQTSPGSLRYWDGVSWTEHAAPATAPPAAPYGHASVTIKPGKVAVWVTAILSLFTFSFRSVDATGHVTTVSIPLGVVFAIVCWRLVAKARAEAARLRVPLPGAYDAARWTALALAVLSVLASVNAMTG